VPSASIAPLADEVKGTLTPPRRDTGDGYPRRPDVLKRMRPSCVKVWDVLFGKAQGEAIQISLRDLSRQSGVSYTHVRRCLVELERVHLIRWRPGGRGRGRKSVIEVLWRSYPAKKDPPIEKPRKNPRTPLQFGGSQRMSFKNGERPSLRKDPPKIKSQDSSPSGRPPATAGASSPAGHTTPPAKGKTSLSSRAHRWAVSEIRRRMRETWPLEDIADMDAPDADGLATMAIGLDHEHVLTAGKRRGLQVWEDECATLAGPDREVAMLMAAKEVQMALINAFATALHRAIKRGRIQTGRELAAVVDYVLDELEADAEELFPRLSESLAVGCYRPVYAWASHAVQQARDALATRRMLEEERRREQERLRQVAEERERIRKQWEAFSGSWRDFLPQGATTKPPQAPIPKAASGTTSTTGDPEPTPREDPQAIRAMLRRTFNWNRGGYWTLGGGSSSFQRRKQLNLSPGEACRLERELEARLRAAELAGDRELAGRIFTKLVELQRAVFRG